MWMLLRATVSSLIVLVGLLASGAYRPALGQDLALADRRPRFLYTPSPGMAPVEIQASRNAMLRRLVSLDLEQPTVGRLLDAIERQTGLKFLYSADRLPANRVVPLRAESITIAAALTEILLDSGLDVVLSTGNQVAFVEVKTGVAGAWDGEGAIAGRVTDKRTGSGLVGATVTVDGIRQSAVTGSDGRYRLAKVAPGTYTVRARYIGYAPGMASVAVGADQDVTADFVLEQSAQQLSEVVTTGTVTPTEIKALPTPISVVTGDEIARKGYQRVDQIFRGDIPGAIAWDPGSLNYLADINIRGASTIGTGFVKTYIDGVELASRYDVTLIDPASIERIEVLRGPQGSTIYGSDATGGVMQIFTKKGAFNSGRPQIEAKASAGFVESQWDNTVQQDHSLAVAGGGRDFSYQVGGGYMHFGDWVPEAAQTKSGLHGSARMLQGPLTVELSTRYSNMSIGSPFNPAFGSFLYYSKPFYQHEALRQQTYGVNVGYVATPHWRHNLRLGYDQTGSDTRQTQPRLTTPADSFLTVSEGTSSKASVAYNTTYETSLGRAVSASLTAGVEYWRFHSEAFFGSRADTSASYLPSAGGDVTQYDNSGYFAQAQLGLSDALFLTAGLRAEKNSNFGADFGLAWAPRAGVSYVRAIGDVTAKARVAYGKAIRPPDPGLATHGISVYDEILANAHLGPELQRGWDGGLELYFGTRASLEATYYNQTAVGLIDFVAIDLNAAPPKYQYQNIGEIKNKGWEFEGRLNAGRLSLSGTYSITSSVVQALSPTYTGELLPGDPMLEIPKHVAGATLSYGVARTAINLGMTSVGSWTADNVLQLYGYYYGGQPYLGSPRAYWTTYPAFTKLNLSVSQGVNDRLSVFAQADNLTNSQAAERYDYVVNHGRVTTIGLRAKF